MEPLCLSVMIMVESRRPPNPSFSKALSVINHSCAAFISQQWRGCWLECFSKGARNVLVAFNVVPDPHVRSQAAFNQKLIEGENLLKSKLLVLKRHYIHHLTLNCIASCVNVSSMHSLSRSPSVQSSGPEVRAEQASKLQCLNICIIMQSSAVCMTVAQSHMYCWNSSLSLLFIRKLLLPGCGEYLGQSLENMPNELIFQSVFCKDQNKQM